MRGQAQAKLLLYGLGPEHDDRTRWLVTPGYGIEQEKALTAFHLAPQRETQRASIEHLDAGEVAHRKLSRCRHTDTLVTVEDVAHAEHQDA